MNLDFPDARALRTANDVSVEEYPRFAPVERIRSLDPIADIERATRNVLESLPLAGLSRGASIGLTAGSRGIKDKPEVLGILVEELVDRGYEPFVLAAMGSHGGATADGQRETLASLGMTEARLGCDIRSSMAVDVIDQDESGRDVYVARDALEADGVIVINRIKPHTDFSGPVESGLSKMIVVGLGKHHGAESLHNAGLAGDFATVIRDRTARIIAASPIIGGIGLIEDAHEDLTHIEGVPHDQLLDREPALLERAYEEIPTLPVDHLDILIVDRIGKDISGTCLDTNVLGRYRFFGSPEPSTPEITRVYARSLTPASHGNALGVGLADFVHRDVIADIDFEHTYVNIATSGEPERAKIPFVVPDDRTALTVMPSTVGVDALDELRIARIASTLDPDRLLVSEPVARELEDEADVSVGARSALEFDGADLESADYDLRQ